MVAILSDREQEIIQRLMAAPALSVAELSQALDVSAVTIRSDLAGLEEKGLLLRTRGGAAPAFHPGMLERSTRNLEAKQRIAKAAAAMVDDGDSLMIEAGTTTALIARHLLGKRDLHIVTDSTLLLPWARLNPQLRLTLVGGEFQASSEAMTGPIALRELEQFYVKTAFIGTDGFSLDQGLTTHLVDSGEVVKKMVSRCDKVVLVADSSKFGQTGFVRMLALSDVDVLVSDTGLEAPAVAAMEKAGVQVILA